MVVLAPHGKVEKALSVARLATYKFLVSVDAVVGLQLLATILADKHTATVRPISVRVRRWQRLESLVTHIKGMNPLSLVACVKLCASVSRAQNNVTTNIN